jgi:hypothetical protein
VRTVSRSSVAKWPDSGATSSTGWPRGLPVLAEMQQGAEGQGHHRLLFVHGRLPPSTGTLAMP